MRRSLFSFQLQILRPRGFSIMSHSSSAILGTFKVPEIYNEPMRSYPPGSEDRANLKAALNEFKNTAPIEIPVYVNGEEIRTGRIVEQRIPSEHEKILAKYHEADSSIVEKAIKAEIDAAAELIDFWRFNCKYAHEIYQQQPPKNAPGVWNRVEYRPLEGFVYAISPFNFTAIGGNLPSAPALMGNVILWKPSPNAALSNWIIMEILREAGLPDGVIQFIPGPAQEITDQILKSPDFASLHFTGSTFVFKKLWKEIGNNIEIYKSYPRIVGETGGKNFHVIHESANLKNAVNQTIRGAFEYQGQKCSACSRAYVPDSLWNDFRENLLGEISKVKVGPMDEFSNFVGPVIHAASFEKIKGYIEWAKNDADSEIIAGGTYDNSKGYFVDPTVIVTKNPKSKTICEEIFGFAQDRAAIILGESKLRHASGNFYINDKSTGAIVGQQPFGGSRASGTNDKAGSPALLYRFTSMRTIKENFVDINDFSYPSNLI
ncbi:19594_t:CDS:2 [Cetraspora pellucida]|uniref:L-glutamate gamma-semialdehyde dehydrogenase n=1 Tax=Cetraspora pellucida TaxID=1433469 RepID=A0A9N8ZJU6_9GLOM|nr:19594_t:CDS:2 [Cetraspora pellucida]